MAGISFSNLFSKINQRNEAETIGQIEQINENLAQLQTYRTQQKIVRDEYAANMQDEDFKKKEELKGKYSDLMDKYPVEFNQAYGELTDRGNNPLDFTTEEGYHQLTFQIDQNRQTKEATKKREEEINKLKKATGKEVFQDKSGSFFVETDEGPVDAYVYAGREKDKPDEEKMPEGERKLRGWYKGQGIQYPEEEGYLTAHDQRKKITSDREFIEEVESDAQLGSIIGKTKVIDGIPYI